MKKLKVKIQQVPISKIVPYWRNPRINDDAVSAVAQSIKNYGFNVPIVLDKNFVIITGHTRYKACLQLGIEEIPCVISDMDEKKAKEYRIADNKTTELSKWNEQNLILELREITNIEDFNIYFPEVDLNSMLSESVGINIDPITYEDIEKSSDKINNSFKENVNEALNELIEVTCPSCGETFMVKKNDILKRC